MAVNAPAAAGPIKKLTKREEDLGPPAPMRKVTNGTTVVSMGASWQLLPNIKLLPFSDSKDREVASLYGPLDENDETLKEYQNLIVGRSVSTYPYLMGVRCGDPNCDRFSIKAFTNRSVIAISDGCNWGMPPREASEKANNGFLDFMRKSQKKLSDTHTLGHYLCDAITEAHRAVCAKKIEGEDAAGTTTLLGGMLARTEQSGQWVFTCINVGDCKAFLFQTRTKTIVDITEGNRTSLKNARDPGGRLGGFTNSKPDLRNLALYQQTMEEGDILMVVSDGVHDNLDPQALGVAPQELLMEASDWQDVSDEDCQDAKSKFRLRLLSILLSKEEWTPHNIVQRVIKHATNVTKKTREWMQANPTKREPTDTKAFPGKMDHTTCLCIRVGALV